VPLQPDELQRTEGYKSADLEKALSQVFVRMDELMISIENKEELQALRGGDAEDDSDQQE
jgi:hypothetical protein